MHATYKEMENIMKDPILYYKFSDFLKEKYGQKVYKLPLNLPVTCPNRDGKCGNNGCIFCGEEGAGFETLPSQLPIKEQLDKNSSYIGRNYGASKFIAYFQNYSNTYMPINDFKKAMLEACVEDVVAVYVSTRPDCIAKEYLEVLADMKAKKGVDVVVETGLQTVNYHTLQKLNRGHTLAEFIDAIVNIKAFGLESCAHYIVDLPFDDRLDVIEGAKILGALKVEQVKCHSLFILEDTKLGQMYKDGIIKPVSLEEYIERLVLFLEHLPSNTVVQRLVGRAPEERSLFCNFGLSWWKIKDMLENKMQTEKRYQGNKANYLNGKSVRDFV